MSFIERGVIVTRMQISDRFTFFRLIRFALPTIIMVIFTSLYGIVDGLFISNVVGDDAFTAVNLFLPVFYMLGSIGFLLGSGGCALIAKLFGQGDEHTARRMFSGLFIITAVTAATFTAIMIPVMPRVASALGAKGDVYGHCVTYGRIMLAGLVPFILQSFFQYYFAVADRPKLGLAITVAAGVTNMLGDFLLIYVADMGVVGAAVATIVGECVGSVIPVAYFFIKKGKRLYFAKPSFNAKTIFKICSNGSSEMITNISSSLVNMLYNFQLLKYIGNDGVVAYGILMYIGFIFIGCYLGFAVGVSPIVGYNYGANDREQLQSIFKKCLLFYTAAAVIMTALSEALASPLAYVFVNYDENLLELTTLAIRIYSLSFLISGFNIFASAFFTALNNGPVSFVISVSRTLLFQIGAVFLTPLIFGVNGIWSATAVAELLSLAISVTMIMIYRKKYGYVKSAALNSDA